MSATSGPVEPRRRKDGLLPIDWGAVSPLRLQARVVAEGFYAGMHRSTRRGAGVEFGGQRPYVPGDDLRFLDRRSLLRHDKLMVREFETDTDRALWLCLDASASMVFRSKTAMGAKLAYAALIAAALGRVAVASHDPVGLAWLGGEGLNDLRPAFGHAAHERIVSVLETAQASGKLAADLDEVKRCGHVLGRRARRGSMIVLLSDLLDLPPDALRYLASLGGSGRVLVAVQVLDPVERDLSFSGKVRLRAIERDTEVTTDADAVREQYQRRLHEHTEAWRIAVESAGGRLVRACTDDEPVGVLRTIVQASAEARR